MAIRKFWSCLCLSRNRQAQFSSLSRASPHELLQLVQSDSQQSAPVQSALATQTARSACRSLNHLLVVGTPSFTSSALPAERPISEG